MRKEPIYYILPLPEQHNSQYRKALIPDDIYEQCAKSIAFLALSSATLDDFIVDAICYMESGGVQYSDVACSCPRWLERFDRHLRRMGKSAFYNHLMLWFIDYYEEVRRLADMHLGPGWRVENIFSWRAARALGLEVFYEH